MKNIYILPTHKLSRVFTTKDEGLGFDNQMLENTELDCQNQNIYITSDEDIKKRDWFVNFDLLDRLDTIYDPIHKCLKISNSTITSFEVQVEDEFTILKSFCKKIILTTDQDLISDGIEPILMDECLCYCDCEKTLLKNKIPFKTSWGDIYVGMLDEVIGDGD